MIPRVLAIAGSDPSGGAGIQGDLKTIAALGGYGMAAITALTAQNTIGVRAIHVPPAAFLRAQLDAVGEDIPIDAVKIGMLGDRAVIETVTDWLRAARPPLVVLDPVMTATTGARLLEPGAEDALRELCSLADIVTPNRAELATLNRTAVAADWSEALEHALRLSKQLGVAVIAKGGHFTGPSCPDALVDAAAAVAIVEVDGPRVAAASSHGTGCSLSSALATLIPQQANRLTALRAAKAWLARAIGSGAALQIGRGHGPLDHFVDVRGMTRAFEPAVEHEATMSAIF